MNQSRDIDGRMRRLNDKPVRAGDYVLYWMQQSQRAQYNHALEYAIGQANGLKLPVVVVFGLTADYPEANWRHYRFMLEGLRETRQALRQRQIPMQIRLDAPVRAAIDLGQRAALIVCDRGYLRHQVAWRQAVAHAAPCALIEVESDLVVPVETASDKQEYAARTMRPKLRRRLEDFLIDLPARKLLVSGLAQFAGGENMDQLDPLLRRLGVDRSVPAVSWLFKGGTTAAKARFARFLQTSLQHYDSHSNQPQTDDISHMSPYLHFGQISPLYLALQVSRVDHGAARDAYIEQLVVRRELAFNYVHFQPNYDQLTSLPGWALNTLDAHRHDPRDPLYPPDQLEQSRTHDPYWNAAMDEMRHTGFMHNYMRMYWAKKILQWSASPEDAFQTTLYLNNRYFLDGRDPNSYVGVAWNYGLHDRAWKERPVFGKIRYMAAAGLRRKCDIEGYVRKVAQRIR